MNFNPHPNIIGEHAFLSPSKYHWINYDDAKLLDTYEKCMATERGTRLHEFAAECIRLGQKLPNSKKTLNMYVNDAIGYHMTPEQPLYFSDNAFGTADSISFKKDKLRIHDYKSGETPASMHQLEIYTALFCLEYKVKPGTIAIELRIYQLDNIVIAEPEADIILPIMDKIITFDKLISKAKAKDV